MTRTQIIRVAILSAIILLVVIALDYLVNVVIAPGVTPYTPVGTLVITMLVAPVFTAYLILQNAKVEKAQLALAEERVARLAADAANATKTRFLANMSHELRTPLNAIIGYAEIIEEDAESGAILGDSQRITRSARHLLGLIDEILDHVKLEAGELRLVATQVDLQPLFDEVADAIRAQVEGKGVELSSHCDAGIGAAWIDGHRLKQCMLSLADNAAKFTVNGRVALRMSVADADEILFEVSDTGPGIAADALAKLFQPFIQADTSLTRASGGTGIGLALTKQLMDAMGGSIANTSALGVGSTFTLRLKRGAAPSNVVTLAA